MKKEARAVGMAASLGMAAWAGYSYMKMNKPVPPREDIDAYARSLAEIVGQDYDSWREEIREEVLPVDGRELHLYFFDAQPEDPVVVMIPGMSMYAILYTELMSGLSREGFNVVGYDPRGHGLSSGKRGSYTLGELVEDARAVIGHVVGIYGERVAVAGSSQGGMTAFYCAAAEPRLKAAVCHNLVAPDEPDNYRMTRWPGLYRRIMSLSPLMELPLVRLMLGELRIPIPAYLPVKAMASRLIPDVGKFFREDPLLVTAVSLSALNSLATTPLARKVEEIETPIMVIHSEKDEIFPEDYVRRVYDRLNCEKEFLYIPDCTHFVTIDRVDDIIPPISRWLKKYMKEDNAHKIPQKG